MVVDVLLEPEAVNLRGKLMESLKGIRRGGHQWIEKTH